jgi:hypothetical protein
MNILQAIVYGIVEGATEFLPVSSTAHINLVPYVFGWEKAPTAFTAIIQLGAIVAVVLYFWKDLSGAKGYGRGSNRVVGRNCDGDYFCDWSGSSQTNRRSVSISVGDRSLVDHYGIGDACRGE